MSDLMKKTLGIIGSCLWLLVLNELDVLRGFTEFISIVFHI